jgi:hypothetical protein
MSSTGESSTAITVPVARSPRSNDSCSLPSSVAGSTVGVASPRTAVSSNTSAFSDLPPPSLTAAMKASARSGWSASVAASRSAWAI